MGKVSVVDLLTDEITSLVYDLTHSWDAYFDAQVKEMDIGLTGRQALVMWMAQAHAPLSMGALARILRLDPSSVTGLIARLETKGLVKRVADPSDRRGTRIELTPTGRQLRRRLERTLLSARPSLAGMSQAEKRTLRDLLKRAMEGL